MAVDYYPNRLTPTAFNGNDHKVPNQMLSNDSININAISIVKLDPKKLSTDCRNCLNKNQIVLDDNAINGIGSSEDDDDDFVGGSGGDGDMECQQSIHPNCNRSASGDNVDGVDVPCNPSVALQNTNQMNTTFTINVNNSYSYNNRNNVLPTENHDNNQSTRKTIKESIEAKRERRAAKILAIITGLYQMTICHIALLSLVA